MFVSCRVSPFAGSAEEVGSCVAYDNTGFRSNVVIFCGHPSVQTRPPTSVGSYTPMNLSSLSGADDSTSPVGLPGCRVSVSRGASLSGFSVTGRDGGGSGSAAVSTCTMNGMCEYVFVDGDNQSLKKMSGVGIGMRNTMVDAGFDAKENGHGSTHSARPSTAGVMAVHELPLEKRTFCFDALFRPSAPLLPLGLGRLGAGSRNSRESATPDAIGRWIYNPSWYGHFARSQSMSFMSRKAASRAMSARTAQGSTVGLRISTAYVTGAGPTEGRPKGSRRPLSAAVVDDGWQHSSRQYSHDAPNGIHNAASGGTAEGSHIVENGSKAKGSRPVSAPNDQPREGQWAGRSVSRGGARSAVGHYQSSTVGGPMGVPQAAWGAPNGAVSTNESKHITMSACEMDENRARAERRAFSHMTSCLGSCLTSFQSTCIVSYGSQASGAGNLLRSVIIPDTMDVARGLCERGRVQGVRLSLSALCVNSGGVWDLLAENPVSEEEWFEEYDARREEERANAVAAARNSRGLNGRAVSSNAQPPVHSAYACGDLVAADEDDGTYAMDDEGVLLLDVDDDDGEDAANVSSVESAAAEGNRLRSESRFGGRRGGSGTKRAPSSRLSARSAPEDYVECVRRDLRSEQQFPRWLALDEEIVNSGRASGSARRKGFDHAAFDTVRLRKQSSSFGQETIPKGLAAKDTARVFVSSVNGLMEAMDRAHNVLAAAVQTSDAFGEEMRRQRAITLARLRRQAEEAERDAVALAKSSSTGRLTADSGGARGRNAQSATYTAQRDAMVQAGMLRAHSRVQRPLSAHTRRVDSSWDSFSSGVSGDASVAGSAVTADQAAAAAKRQAHRTAPRGVESFAPLQSSIIYVLHASDDLAMNAGHAVFVDMCPFDAIREYERLTGDKESVRSATNAASAMTWTIAALNRDDHHCVKYNHSILTQLIKPSLSRRSSIIVLGSIVNSHKEGEQTLQTMRYVNACRAPADEVTAHNEIRVSVRDRTLQLSSELRRVSQDSRSMLRDLHTLLAEGYNVTREALLGVKSPLRQDEFVFHPAETLPAESANGDDGDSISDAKLSDAKSLVGVSAQYKESVLASAHHLRDDIATMLSMIAKEHSLVQKRCDRAESELASVGDARGREGVRYLENLRKWRKRVDELQDELVRSKQELEQVRAEQQTRHLTQLRSVTRVAGNLASREVELVRQSALAELRQRQLTARDHDIRGRRASVHRGDDMELEATPPPSRPGTSGSARGGRSGHGSPKQLLDGDGLDGRNILQERMRDATGRDLPTRKLVESIQQEYESHLARAKADLMAKDKQLVHTKAAAAGEFETCRVELQMAHHALHAAIESIRIAERCPQRFRRCRPNIVQPYAIPDEFTNTKRGHVPEADTIVAGARDRMSTMSMLVQVLNDFKLRWDREEGRYKAPLFKSCVGRDSRSTLRSDSLLMASDL